MTKLALASVLLIIFSNSKDVSADTFTIQNDKFERLYVLKESVNVYENKDVNSRVFKTLNVGTTFHYSKNHYSSIERKMFVPYAEYINGGWVQGWVERSNLVADQEFKLIKLYWPFKHISYIYGDYFQDIVLDSEGKGVTRSNAGSNMPTNVYKYDRFIKIQYIHTNKNQYSYPIAFVLKADLKHNKISLINSGAYLEYETHNKAVK